MIAIAVVTDVGDDDDDDDLLADTRSTVHCCFYTRIQGCCSCSSASAASRDMSRDSRGVSHSRRYINILCRLRRLIRWQAGPTRSINLIRCSSHDRHPLTAYFQRTHSPRMCCVFSVF